MRFAGLNRISVLIPLTLHACTVFGQDPDFTKTLSAQQIIEMVQIRNAARAARLRAFTGTRVYESVYSGTFGHKQARMEVRVSYIDRKKTFTIVSEAGSRLIINRVFRNLLQAEQEASSVQGREESGLSQRNYRFELLPADRLGVFRIAVTPRRKAKFLFDGVVWIDATDFALIRIQARPVKNPSIWLKGTSIVVEYTKIDEFWMPSTNHSRSKVRLGGTADLDIEYRDYKMEMPENDKKDVAPPSETANFTELPTPGHTDLRR